MGVIRDNINEFLEWAIQKYKNHILRIDETAPESEFVKVGKNRYRQTKTGKYCYQGYGGPWNHRGMIEFGTNQLIYSDVQAQLDRENEASKQYSMERGWYSYIEHIENGNSGSLCSYYYLRDLRKERYEDGFSFDIICDYGTPTRFTLIILNYTPLHMCRKEERINFETFLKLALCTKENHLFLQATHKFWVFFEHPVFKRMLHEKVIVIDPKYKDNYLIVDYDRCDEILKEGSDGAYRWFYNLQKPVREPYSGRIRQTS